MPSMKELVATADYAIEYLEKSVQECLSRVPPERARFDEVGAFAEFVAQGGEPLRRLQHCGMVDALKAAVVESRVERQERCRRSALELIACRRADAARVKEKLSLLAADAAFTRQALIRLKAEQAATQRQERKSTTTSATAVQAAADGVHDPANNEQGADPFVVSSGASSDDLPINEQPIRPSTGGRGSRSEDRFALTRQQEEGRARILGVFPKPPELIKRKPKRRRAGGDTADESISSQQSGDDGGADDPFERLTKPGKAFELRCRKELELRQQLAEASTLRGVCYYIPKATPFSQPLVYSAGPTCSGPQQRAASAKGVPRKGPLHSFQNGKRM